MAIDTRGRTQGAPLAREGLLARIAPFAVPAILAFGTVALPPAPEGSAPGLTLAAALGALIVAAVALLPWERLPSWAHAVPILAYVLVVAALRESEGGAVSGFTILYLLPVAWLALYGTRGELVAAIVLTSLALFAPVLALGDPDYPVTEWRRAALWVLVAPVVGFTVQRLVTDVRRRGDLRDALADVVGELSEAGDARKAVCRAACRVGEAQVAVLFERGERATLTSTAVFGAALRPVALRAEEEPSGALVALTSGRPFFVGEARENPALSPGLVEATGAASCLFQPVCRRERPIGVLAVIWTSPRKRLRDPVAEAFRTLASKAVLAIERVDLLARLADLAHTDELTGLFNRRALNEELPRAIARAERDGRPLSAIVIDLDHFKDYNDRLGHQAGDRFLKETAAAWQSHTRRSDFIARYGGEEFSIAMVDCGLEEAKEALELLRALTPDGASSSAGVALWDASETEAELVARADAALYEAKRGGRDRVISA